MPLADGPKTEDEAQASLGGLRLIGVRDDAGIEQGGGFERILTEKIGAHQLTLRLGEDAVRRKSILHFIRAGLEPLEQVTMSPLEIFEDISKLNCNGFGTERENPVDDMICAHLVGRIEVARLGRRLERSHDDSRWIGAQMKPLPVQERSL